MHFEKVFDSLDAIVGEGYDGILADTVDPDDTVLWSAPLRVDRIRPLF